MDTILNKNITAESINSLNRECENARQTDIARAMEICYRAISAAKAVGYNSGLAKAYLNAGICSRLSSDFEAAIEYFSLSLAIYRQTGA